MSGHHRPDGDLTVNATGVQETSGSSSATVAIPNAADGNVARHVRIAALGNVYVRPGISSTTCTVNDILVTPYEAIVLNVQGFSYIAYLQQDTAAKLNITPLEVG